MKNGKLRFLYTDHASVAGVTGEAGACDDAVGADDVDADGNADATMNHW